MLIISRKKDEKIMIGDNIEVVILETGRNRVRFGINAPRHVSVQTRVAPQAAAAAEPAKAEVKAEARAEAKVEAKVEKDGMDGVIAPAPALKV